MYKNLMKFFFVLCFVAASSNAVAQAQHDHDHTTCNHQHEKPSAIALKIDSCRNTLSGKWKSADGTKYYFAPEHKLLIGKKSPSAGRWELMGREGGVMLRLWTVNESGTLFPRYYDISAINPYQFSLSQMFGGTDTLHFKRIGKPNK